MTAVITQDKNTMKKGADKMSEKKPTSKPKRLKKYRLDAGFTIYSLADRIGASYSTISYWENGIKHPRHDKIMALEDIFKTTYRDLFTDLTDEEIAEIEQRKNENKE